MSGCDSYASFQNLHRTLVDDALGKDKIKRETRWSQSIAVGNKKFVTDIKKKLTSKVVGRKVRSLDDDYALREEILPYIVNFEAENNEIAQKNAYKWGTFPEISEC